MILKTFGVTDLEYDLIDKKFGKLAHTAAWELLRKNSRNNHTDEQEDIAQRLRISFLRAGSYYKRQTYIENCLDLCRKYVEDRFLRKIINELFNLWKNKTRHGAHRQKFGPHQEKILDQLSKTLIPTKERPSKKKALILDSAFTTYCKSIMWNEQKAMGRKITREKPIRTGLVSISDFDYLGATG